MVPYGSKNSYNNLCQNILMMYPEMIEGVEFKLEIAGEPVLNFNQRPEPEIPIHIYMRRAMKK